MPENQKRAQDTHTQELIAFIFYCVTFMGIGTMITGLGPLLPYFADAEQKDPTEYSFLFFCRAAGYCLGSLLCKVWEKCFKYHGICFVSSILIAIFLVGFSWAPWMPVKSVFMFLSAIMNATLEIFINMAIIEAKKNENLQKWLQINHGAFGVGGLLGPLLVYWFEQWSYAFMSVAFVISAPAYLLIQSPQITSKKKQDVEEALLSESEKQRNHRSLSLFMSFVICGLFMLLVGEQTAYGGWISAYAVINHIKQKEQATFYSSLFWVTMTVFRFVFLILPGKPSQKSLAMYMGSIFIAVTSICFLKIFPQLGNTWMIYSSAGLGMFFSIVFPLLLSTPKEFGIDLHPSDNSNFVIAASLGQGIIAVLTGYLMDWFGSDMLFYSVLGVRLIVLVGHFYMIYQFSKEMNEDHEFSIKFDKKQDQSMGFEITEANNPKNSEAGSENRIEVQAGNEEQIEEKMSIENQNKQERTNTIDSVL